MQQCKALRALPDPWLRAPCCPNKQLVEEEGKTELQIRVFQICHNSSGLGVTHSPKALVNLNAKGLEPGFVIDQTVVVGPGQADRAYKTYNHVRP